jgi:hypothetical protein
MRKFYTATNPFKTVALLFSMDGIFASVKSFFCRKIPFLLLIIVGITSNLKAQTDCAISNSVSPSVQQIYCLGASSSALTATITKSSGSGPSSITYEWFSNTSNSVSGGISVQGPTTTTTSSLTNSFTPPATVAGTLWYYCTVTNNDVSCLGTSNTTSTVEVIVNPLLPVSVSIVSDDADNIICAGTTVTFTATPGYSGGSPLYQWRVNGLNVGTNSGVNTFSTSSLTSGSTVSVVLTDLTPCVTGSPATSNTIATTVNPIPTITGSTPGSVCGTGTVTLGATASAGTINWYAAATGGPSLGTGISFITPSISGNTTYYADATANGCTTGTRTAVLATVNPIPTITGATPGSVCGTGTVTLGATASAGTINWYAAATGGPSLGTGISFITPSISGNTTYYADATANGCTTGTRTAVLATVNTIPTITGSTPGSVCGTGTVTLGATASAGTINWYAAATGGSSLGIGTSFTTPSISSTTTYYTDATASGCTTGTRTAVVATVNTTPTITGTTPGSVCGTGTVTLGATASAGTINWYAASTGGSSLGTGTSFITPSISSTTTYYADATASGCTTGTRTAVLATVNTVPTITGSTPNNRCGTGTVTLGATASAGTINWYAAPTGGSSLGTGTSFTTPSISATTTYYVDATAVGCITGTRTAVIATVNPVLVPSVSISASATTICSGTSVTFTATPTNGGTTPSYQWKLNGSINVGTNSATYNTTTLADGNAITVVLNSNATCAAPTTPTSNSIAMKVYSSGAANIANNSISGPTSICPPASGLVYTVTGVARADSYVWTLPPGFSITSGAGTNTITVSVSTAATAGSPNISVYATNPCGQGNDRSYSVNVNSFAGISAGANQSVCPGGTVTLAAVWSGVTASSMWTAPSGSFSAPSAVNSTYTPTITSGNVTLTVTTNDPTGVCIATNSQIVISINPRPTAIISTTAGAICNGTSKQISIALTGAQPWSLTYTDGTTPINVTGITTSPYLFNVSPTASTTTYTVTALSDANCTSQAGDRTGSAVVNVNARPTSVISTTAPAICNGTSKQISIALTGAQPWSLTYTDGTTPVTVNGITTSPYTFNVSPAVNTTYTVTALSDANCTAQAGDRTGSAVVNVNVRPTSVISTTAPAICNGTSKQISIALTGAQPWSLTYTDGTTPVNVTGITTSPYTFNVSPTASTITYTVTALSDANCTSQAGDRTGSAVVNVNARPTSVISTTAPAICNGTSKQISIALTGAQPWSLTYTDGTTPVNVTGITTSPYTFNVSPAVNTTYTVTALSDASCTAQAGDRTGSAAVTVTARPTSLISTTAGAICNGTSKQISIALTGTQPWSLTYTDGTTPVNVTGITASPYAFNVSPAVNTTYTVTALSDASCTAQVGDRTGTAAVTVIQPASITTPPTPQTVCSSFPVSFSVVAANASSYKWYKDGVAVTNSGTTTGATTANLSIGQAAVSQSGIYTVEVFGSSPCGSVTSTGVQLTVNQDIDITTEPIAQIVCEGTPTTTFTVAATGSISSYVWRRNGIPVSGSNYSGETTPTLTITNATASNIGSFDVVVSGTSGSCPQAISAPATLSVNPVSVGGSVAGGTTVCTGTNSTTLTLSGQTGSVIRWESSLDNFATPGTTIANTTTTLTATNLTAATSYRAVVQSGVCAAENSASATVTVNAVSVGGTVAGAATVCSGTNITTLTLSGQTGTVVRWESSLDNFATAGTTIASTTATLTATNLIATTSYRAFVQSGVCAAVNSVSATVTVNAISVGGTVAGAATVCSGTNSTTLTLSGQTGTVVRWESSLDNFATAGTTIANTTTTLTATNLTANTSYRAVVQSGVCAAVNSVSATVTVNAVSVGGTVAGAATVCSGTNSTTLTLSGQTGSVIRWESSLDNFATAGTTIANTTTTLTATNLTANTSYRAVVQSGVCAAVNSVSATVTVNAVSVGGTVAGAATVCSGTNSTTLTLSGQTGTVVRWESSLDNFATAGTTIANTTANLTATNLTANTSYRAIVQSGACAAVNSAFATVTVTPASFGGTLSPASSSGCANSNSGTITLNSNVGSVIGWEYSTNGGSTWSPVTPTNTTINLNYSNLSISTFYRAVIKSGICAATANSTVAMVIVNQPYSPAITVSATTICFGQSVTFTAAPFSAADTINGGNFSQANPAGWSGGSSSNSNGGTPLNWGESAAQKAYGDSTYVSGSPSGPKYQIVSGNVTNALTTNSFSTIGRTSLTLDWYQGYNLKAGATAQVQISTDSISYTTLASYTNSAIQTNGFNDHQTINLNAYLGQPKLWIRFFYTGTVNSAWAVDDVNVLGPFYSTTYTWPPGFIVSGNTATFTPTSSGPISYTFTTTYAGCTATTTSTPVITVNPLPTIAPSASAAAVCSNTLPQTTTLAYSATTNAPTNYSITWDAAPTNTFSSITNAPLPTSPITIAIPANTAAGTYTGTITVTNANGCAASTGVPFTVTVNALPTSVTVSGVGTYCGSTTITAANGGSGTIYFQGTTSGGTSTATPSTSQLISASGTYYFRAQSAEGCWGTEGSVTVTINALPTAVTVSGGGTFCGSTTITAANGGSGTIYFQGTTSGGTSIATPSSSQLISASGTYYFRAQSAAGCWGIEGSVVVTINPTPSVTVSASTVCDGAPSLITAIPLVSGTYTYAWTVPTAATDPGDVASFISTVTGNYSVIITANSCPSAPSPLVNVIAASNTWTGAVDNDWQKPGNWSCAAVPTSLSNVIIPAITPQPQLTAASFTKTLTLQGTAEVDLNGFSLTNSGSVTMGAGTFKGSPASDLSFDAAGSSAINFNQGIDGTTNALNNLTINSAAAVTLNNKVSIYGALTPTDGTLTLNDTLTLRSTSSSTARVGIVGGTIAYSGAGRVTVERYYPARGWRLITGPVYEGGSIYDNWQNKGIMATMAPGKGTLITGSIPSTFLNGLDVGAPYLNPTLRTGNSVLTDVNDTKNNYLSTPSASKAANLPYFLFLRGDRNPANFVPGAYTLTTLSSTGKLQTGPQKFDVVTTAESFTMIGNPYASPVDFKNLNTTSLPRSFYVWDPYQAITGAYVTFVETSPGSYIKTPFGSTATPFIQSGQAFYVNNFSGGTAQVIFNETDKSTANNLTIFRPMNPVITSSLAANLFMFDNKDSAILSDGNFAQFDDNFSAGVDLLDAKKLLNTNESFSIQNGKTSLVVDRMPTPTMNDTLFYQLTRTTAKKYQFQFIATNLGRDNLAGFVQDQFTHTATPMNMNGTTKVNFAITSDKASATANRFRVVFKPSVVYTNVAANVLASDIGVQWNVASEENIKGYEIERSTDGTHFTKVADQASAGNSDAAVAYNWLDVAPALGQYYYRIRSISYNDVIGYSNIVKVKLNRSTPAIYVFPNPVTQNTIHLQMNGMEKGVYAARLMNNLGQVVMSNYIAHMGGTATETLRPANTLLAGIYQLEIAAPDKKITTIKVIVQYNK